MSKIKGIFRPIVYFIFKCLGWLKTSFFSNFFIALGYFIKSEFEYNTTTATQLPDDRFNFHKVLATKTLNENDRVRYFEFGVRWGQIVNRWTENNKNPQSVFAGFDTFTGIPEAWGSEKTGTFSNHGEVPFTTDNRVQFHVGLVQDTLPSYLSTVSKDEKMVIHLDFDIYNATLFALVQLIPFIKKGDIIILDEYFSITKNHHEYRAFHDYLSIHKINYTPLYKCRKGQYAIQVN